MLVSSRPKDLETEHGGIMNLAGLKTGGVGRIEIVVERHGIAMRVIVLKGTRSIDTALIRATRCNPTCFRTNGGVIEVNHTTARVIHHGLGGDG